MNYRQATLWSLAQQELINCDAENDASGINSMNEVFINYFLDQGWKNPYGGDEDVVYTARNGSKDLNRMRFDETECSSGSSEKQIALWVKTSKEYYPVLIAKDGLNFLFERKKISSIYQQQFNGGVAQLVRARDS